MVLEMDDGFDVDGFDIDFDDDDKAATKRRDRMDRYMICTAQGEVFSFVVVNWDSACNFNSK